MSTYGPFKDRLMTALHTAVGYYNTEHDPNTAVVKAAQDHDFNSEQTARLVEAFNTARTIYHYKSASDRTVGFPLADIDVVIPRLFEGTPAEPKTAAAPYSYSAYDEREHSYHPDAVSHADLEKTAEAKEDERLSGLSLDTLSRQAMNGLRSLRQVAKMAEDEARNAAVNASFVMTKLAKLFRTGFDRDRLADQYARLVAGYRDGEWAPVVAKLAEFVPEYDKASADLITRYASHAVIDDRDLTPHLALMKEAKEWMEVEASFLAGSGQLQKEADAFEREYTETVVPFFQHPAESDLAAFIRPEVLKAAADTKTTRTYKTDEPNLYGEMESVERTKTSPSAPAPGLTSMIADSVASSTQKPIGNFIQTGVERAFTEPYARENKALSDRLKNVQRGIMLQDLLVNDPILAEEAPESVVQAYTALLQLAPEVSTNKEVVRAILRQMVHSMAVSPYDAENWTKLESNLRNIAGKGVIPMQAAQGGKR